MATSLFKALSEETRLLSLLLIHSQGELCVCELMHALDESQPKVSRHLAQLRKAELLSDRRQGQWVFYRINPALPQWSANIIEQTFAGNSALVEPAIARLQRMGQRPARAKSCC
ncbi:metalloregulator ArsR/SmtB family transcription factor [Shewanella sp. Isolate11]|uniref:metalloregulator ArsR/SmtB family transcription factor n=1 Tax=Shewanella sp. Isolate11 TaxID=2908530 RepID=UPI001EFDE129|nr:metalloregulator ArsR/SmtB family transcription factor [Shewanella sp. Isolate11]MCG9695506.1 metalloregulator ArsR/SmtB family transcription factor [Shewanella sp. Isolate11]